MEQNEIYMQGNALDTHRFFQKLTQKQDPRVVYFGDHIWSDVHHGGNFIPSQDSTYPPTKWDSIAVIEELSQYDRRYNNGIDPQL